MNAYITTEDEMI